MITKLTKVQESKIPKFIDKWVSMSSKPTNRKDTTKYTKLLYKNMKEKEPVVIYGESPLSTAIMACIYWTVCVKDIKKRNQLNSQLDSQLNSQLNSQLRSKLRSQLDSQLDSQLNSQLDSQLRSKLRSQLNSQLDSQLNSQLDSQLRSKLNSQLRSKLGSQLRSQLRSQLDSQLDSQLRSQLDSQLGKINTDWYLSTWWLVWCGWYEYGEYVGVKFNKKLYDLFMGFISNVGFSIPYKGICFISENPKEIHWNEQKQLHKDGSASVLYKDGYGLWCLNGVNVGKDIVETPSHKLDCQLIVKEENAQIRSEIIKKIGYDKILKDLQAQKLDTWKEYELYRIKNIDVEDVTIIKFNCPSTGTYYSLRVPPSIVKAREAIQWANWEVEGFEVQT